MGMAASQARFLQLTARRTNIEYMGQQINQERLALANSSAGLFEKMLTLVPPTPPSSQDDKYYTQGYTFTDPDDELQKKINWSSDVVENTDFTGGAAGSTTIIGTKGAATSTMTWSNTQLAAAGTGGTSPSMDDIATALGVKMTDANKALGYTQVIKNVTISHNVYNPDGQYATITKQAPALLEFDNLNRLLNVSLIDKSTVDASEAATVASDAKAVGNGEKLTYSGVFDQTAFGNDMNKYEFQKSAYDYQIERINQQTKQIQSQDKSLELKMKQLDTEHNAVQTEMEAVQKVINKNIESTFKTFA